MVWLTLLGLNLCSWIKNNTHASQDCFNYQEGFRNGFEFFSSFEESLIWVSVHWSYCVMTNSRGHCLNATMNLTEIVRHGPKPASQN